MAEIKVLPQTKRKAISAPKPVGPAEKMHILVRQVITAQAQRQEQEEAEN